MKKGIKDLLEVYAKQTKPNLKIEDVKQHLIFNEKIKKKWMPLMIYALITVLVVIVVIPMIRQKDNEVKENPLQLVANTHVMKNSYTEMYLVNHFERYRGQSVYNIEIEEGIYLTLYTGVEDDKVYLMQSLNSEKPYTISYKLHDEVIKETMYQYDHFELQQTNQVLVILIFDGDNTRSIDIAIDMLW